MSMTYWPRREDRVTGSTLPSSTESWVKSGARSPGRKDIVGREARTSGLLQGLPDAMVGAVDGHPALELEGGAGVLAAGKVHCDAASLPVASRTGPGPRAVLAPPGRRLQLAPHLAAEDDEEALGVEAELAAVVGVELAALEGRS